MSRVIVERPRRGGGWAREGRPRAPDDLPRQEGIRRRHKGSRKSLNENLAPLRRYLEKQVGRPWDLVYSEISAHLRADNTVQQHVRDHLRNFVAVTPRRAIRKRYLAARFGPWYQPLYVDPADGILKRTDQLPEVKATRHALKHRASAPPDRIPLGRDVELRQVAGLWYEVRLAEMPEPVYVAFPEVRKGWLKPWTAQNPVVEMSMTVRRLTTPAVWDVITREAIPVGPAVDEPRAWNDYIRTHRDRRYAVAKRRLSRVELRRHGVEDRPPN